MNILGYIFSDGRVLCLHHATYLQDPDEQGANAIYSYYEAHENIVCDITGCGVILARNCTDGCGTGGFDHFLYYDDQLLASEVLTYIEDQIDADAEIIDFTSDASAVYNYAVAFSTKDELSDTQAHDLFEMTGPDAYDLNCEPRDMCL